MNESKLFWFGSTITFIGLLLSGSDLLMAVVVCIPLTALLAVPLTVVVVIVKAIYKNLVSPIWEWLHK